MQEPKEGIEEPASQAVALRGMIKLLKNDIPERWTLTIQTPSRFSRSAWCWSKLFNSTYDHMIFLPFWEGAHHLTSPLLMALVYMLFLAL
jgi:hypothetical protein